VRSGQKDEDNQVKKKFPSLYIAIEISGKGIVNANPGIYIPIDESADSAAAASTLSEKMSSATESLGIDDENVEAVVGKFSLAWHSLKEVFTATVLKGILGFSTWWCCLAWFASSAIGMGYLSYFAKI